MSTTIPQRTISNSAGQSDAAETLTKDFLIYTAVFPSRFLAVSFLPALPWLDEFHYVTSRVPAYKEVKDVWKCVRYCILSSLGIPRDSHLRFPPRLRHLLSITTESIHRVTTLLAFQFVPDKDFSKVFETSWKFIQTVTHTHTHTFRL